MTSNSQSTSVVGLNRKVWGWGVCSRGWAVQWEEPSSCPMSDIGHLEHVPKGTSAYPSFDAVQDTSGPPGCKCALLARVQLFVHQGPQVLLSRIALKEFSQCIYISGFALTQVLHLSLTAMIKLKVCGVKIRGQTNKGHSVDEIYYRSPVQGEPVDEVFLL